MASAEELKQEGNDHFRAKRWEEALAIYRSALGHLPRRPTPLRRTTEPDDRLEDADVQQVEPQAEQSPPTELDVECAKARAILNANIGACYAKLVR